MTFPADLPALLPPRRPSACQQVLRSNGTSTAADKAVAAARKKVNAICPGAAS
jgi:hypothetical protein